jgi:hypothetical protein
MSLGNSKWKVVAGGGSQRASAATLARQTIAFGVSPLGTVNSLIAIADKASIPSLLDSGPLAEYIAFTLRQGQTRYAVPVNPSQAGGVSTPVQSGTGTGAIAVTIAPHKAILVKCVTSGVLGTAAFQTSIDGGTTWSAVFVSTASPPYTHRVDGTFCTLSFAAASYVATKTLTVGIDGTVTPGSAWVGVVTQVSSPIDDYEVVLTVKTPGALGAATLGISLDNGNSTEPNMLIPSSGVVVLPGTGLVLTCTSAFTQDDTYSFLATKPGYSTSDLNTAVTAILQSGQVTVALAHAIGMPSTTAGAYSQAATMEALMESAFLTYELDWQGLVEEPVVGDIVIPSSTPLRDTADTDSVIRAARGADTNRCAMAAASYRMTSVAGRKQLRPFGWALADRYVDTDPSDDLSAVADGPLRIYVQPGLQTIGRDERMTPGLDDVQINTARTYIGRGLNAFLSITSSGSGFKNMTTQVDYQDAGGVRALNIFIASLRKSAQDFLGARPAVNGDGTIKENAARAGDTKLDKAGKRAVGLADGGDFTEAQASDATASVSRKSQLGAAPKRLDIDYDLQRLGFVSDVSNVVRYSGTLQVGG